MDFDHDNFRLVLEEDRLSSLPDELIHKIMSSFDMKFAVQTCLLSSRWKLLWTSMPCLDFSSEHFGTLDKFSEFITHVLSQLNHQIEVSSVKLNFHGAVNQGFVKKIASYAFSHNVQELDVFCWPNATDIANFPPCLFSSQSLKHYTLNSLLAYAACITPKTPWDFPALTTLHLCGFSLRGYKRKECVDLFSKCVNLKNLTLGRFLLETVETFDIITPRLSKLMLQSGRCSKVMNVIAPQLENLTIVDCSIKYLNAPPGVSTLCYRGYPPLQLSKFGFHSLYNVAICLSPLSPNTPYEKEYEYACKAIKMLQELHSARYLTLNVDIVECISSFPDLLSQNPSPFSNLNCLAIIDSNKKKDAAYEVKISTEAINFLLEKSPNCKFIMHGTIQGLLNLVRAGRCLFSSDSC